MSTLATENATALGQPLLTFTLCRLTQHRFCGCGVGETVLPLVMSIKLSQQTQTVCMCCMWMENSWSMPMVTMSTCIQLLTLNCSACKKHQQDRNEEIDAGQSLPKPCLIPLVPKKGNGLKFGAWLKLLRSR